MLLYKFISKIEQIIVSQPLLLRMWYEIISLVDRDLNFFKNHLKYSLELRTPLTICHLNQVKELIGSQFSKNRGISGILLTYGQHQRSQTKNQISQKYCSDYQSHADGLGYQDETSSDQSFGRTSL